MGRTGKYFDQLEQTFGKGNVTSGYRTQEEQDELVRRGATKATRSSHTYRDGYDLKTSVAATPEELKARLEAAGHKVAYIRRETGKGKNQGTGAHWHVELGDPGKGGTRVAGGNSRPAGGGVLDQAGAAAGIPRTKSVGQEQRASTGVGLSPVDAVFGSNDKLAAGFDKVGETLQKTENAIDVLSVAQAAAHATQIQQKQAQVEDTRAISEEISSGVQNLKRAVQPVFQARQRVNDQLDALVTMNPIERGIRGVFDLNYDKEFLTGQLDSYDRTLKARVNDFDYLNHLNEVALREIDRRYGNETALSGLAVEQGKEDLGLLGQSLASVNGIIANTQAEIQSQVQVNQAQQAMRGDLLDRLDINTIGDLAAQARQAGGIIKYQGVDVSYNELFDRMQKNEQLELSLEGARLGIESNRMQFAEQQAINVVKNMTQAQVEAAIQDQGRYQGIQLPQDALTNALTGFRQRSEVQAANYMEALPAKAAGEFIVQDANRSVAIINRAQGLFGQQDTANVRAIFADQSRLYGELRKAQTTQQPPAVINAIMTTIAANSKAIQAQVDKSILNNAGGDKRAAGYISAFVSGTPMNAGTATEAMTYFAIKGGMPDGMMASPEARQIFQKAQTIVQQNQGVAGMTEAKLQQIVAKQIGQTAFETVGATRFNRMWTALPTLAKRVGNPLGKISQDDWADLEQKSTADAILAMAPKMGVSRETLSTFISTGKPTGNSEAEKLAFDKFKKMTADFNAVKQRAMIDLIDELPSVQPGTPNSQIMIGFLRSPEAQQMASINTQAAESNGLGDFIVGPMAKGALERNIQVRAERFGQAAAASTSDKRASARRFESIWAKSPTARAHFIMTTIPGVGKDGASVLMPYLSEQLQGNIGMQAAAGVAEATGGAGGQTLLMKQEAAMKAYLMGTKFEDPRAEAYRKAAVRGWDESSTAATGFGEQLLDALKNATGLGIM